MRIQIRIVSVIILTMVFYGCAHKQSQTVPMETTDDQSLSCEQKLEELSTDNRQLEQQLKEMEGIREIGKALDDCRRENQELLDKNISLLEDNRILLQQISSFKNIIQEKKETQWKLNKIYEYALTYFETERLTDQVYVLKSEKNIRIAIPQKALFPTAYSAWTTPRGTRLIEKVAEGVKNMNPRHIEIAGHTDSRPLPENISKVYPTNWDLAMARSMSVLRVFQSSGIKEELIHVTSHGQIQPLADNKTLDGRAMNRRVEIIITP